MRHPKRGVESLAPLVGLSLGNEIFGTVGRVCNAVGAGSGGLTWQMSARS